MHTSASPVLRTTLAAAAFGTLLVALALLAADTCRLTGGQLGGVCQVLSNL